MTSLLNRFMRYVTDSDYRFRSNAVHGLYNYMSDEMYLKKMFKASLGYELRLDNPQTFNEKMQWLKLYDRNPQYKTLVDKVAVKPYIESIFGTDIVIPTYGVWNDFNDIDFNSLPESFVLKCNNDSGGIVIFENKNTDIKMAKKKITRHLKKNGFWYGREWPYKDMKPLIFAEKKLGDKGDDIMDYKIHCFNGKPQLILVCSERFSANGLKEDWFDVEWQHLPICRPNHQNSSKEIDCPRQLSRMLEIAEILSADKKFVRVDLYYINDHVYFGEITFYPTSGFTAFLPEEYDYILGDMLNIK